jgi:hypothetical protein
VLGCATIVKKASSPHLWLRLYLPAFTGRREGDLLELRFGARVPGCPFYDGRHLYLPTGKTGSCVKVGAIEPLKTMLDAEIASVAGLPEARRKRRAG